jgi:cell pole-organizing protein PopZ
MNLMNGAKHDVEDILASIRTSIADRSPGFDVEKREARVTTLRGRGNIADEALEFELPAIFKAPAQPAAERPNLLGRLSEALGTNAQHAQEGEWGRRTARTVIPFEPIHGRMIEPPPPVALDNVKETKAAAVPPKDDGIKRIMPTFFDTRMSRMNQTAPVHQPEPEPAPAPVHRTFAPEPPRLPDGGAVADGGVEDAAAQLLRPILKQWLTENMPKIVEKALRDETGKR